MDLVAVHPPLPTRNNIGLDTLRFAPFLPLRPAPPRQKIRLLAALQIAVVVFPKRLGTGPVMPVEVSHPAERGRPPRLHSLVFRYQKSPFLKVIPLNRPVVAIVSHRILLQENSITELVNLHNCEERMRRSNPLFARCFRPWIASLALAMTMEAAAYPAGRSA